MGEITGEEMMENEIENGDEKILKGTRILFVDDRPAGLNFFIQELERVADGDVEICQTKTLQQALDELSAEGIGFDMVVIDLHMPGELPESLKPFEARVGRDLNEGQTLGLWLREKHPHIPYLYLSSVPDAYLPSDRDSPELAPINKFTEKLRDFPAHLAAALRQRSRSLPDTEPE
jgi:CheY-like chemotaxis protein